MKGHVDLVVRDARLLLESGLVRGGVAVMDGRICAVATDEHLPPADTTVDGRGRILMPGLIDAHAHIHDPAALDHEDFTTGSRAAAAGGVTTVIDMPLTSQLDTVEALEQRVRTGEEMSIVDFGLYAGMMRHDNVAIIPQMLGHGVGGFKAFTCEPYRVDSGVIMRLLSEVSEHGGHLTVHAEDQGVLDEFGRDMDGEWDAPVSHALSRPEIAEQLAVHGVIAIARATGGHVHIAHVTTRGGLREVELGRLHGVRVTTEVCPHHLVFDRDQMNRFGPVSKMTPPLRSREDRAALWSGLLMGSVNIVVSDHAPCPPDEKEAGRDDIREAWAGVDGVQMILRVLLSEGINRGRLSFGRLLRATTRDPARLFGLYPKKGAIRVGADADLVLVDPTLEQKVTADMMFSKCGWTLYEGLVMKGAPVMTFVRGVPVFEDDRTTVAPGHGRFQPAGSGLTRAMGQPDVHP